MVVIQVPIPKLFSLHQHTSFLNFSVTLYYVYWQRKQLSQEKKEYFGTVYCYGTDFEEEKCHYKVNMC